MEFKEAAETKMPFGKYKGKTLDKISETDSGLKYLDWAVSIAYGELKEALTVFLSDKIIKKELEKLLED